jgi:tRNA1(Val) A37 N6-methylase TrmN6
MTKTNDNGNDVLETTLLRGRVKLLQPRIGFHASLDTVFLAAAVQARNNSNILDVGCGVGSAGLCVLARNPGIHLVGMDIQRELIDLALQNASLNGFSEHCHFFKANLLSEKLIPDNYFHTVLANPPYQSAGTPSPHKNKAVSHGEAGSGARLADWVKYAHRKLRAGGDFVMIHRADRLDDIILALESRRWFGSIVVFPLWSHAGEDARRVIIRARKERYAPLSLKAGLVVHERNGEYTDGAQRILSAGDALDLN